MLTDTFPSAITTEFQNQWQDGWYPRGPSIAQNPAGEYAAMLIVGDLWRPLSDPPGPNDGVTAEWGDVPGVIRTRNFFTHLDDDLQILGWTECPTPDLPVEYPAVLGVEEPRLYWQDGWKFTGASRQHHAGGEANVAFCTVGSSVTEIVPAPEGAWEKNWMPTGTVMIDAIKGHPEHHGGAAVAFEDGFLGTIHEIIDPVARRYEQRFCRYDAHGNLTAASDLFRFNAYPLQYASGIVFHRGDVVLSWSTQDRVCYLARIPLTEVLATL